MHGYSAGNSHKQLEYSSFQPSFINRPWTIHDPRVLNALSRADRQLGRLDMFSEFRKAYSNSPFSISPTTWSVTVKNTMSV